MAHSCPECNSACHCGGDVDDVLFEDEEHIQGCTHCADLPIDDDNLYWGPEDDDEAF